MSHQAPGEASSAERREVVVRGSASGVAQEIAIAGHRLISDEPRLVGGGDTGPNPYDLLLCALGACTSMTVSLYARRKKWALEAVTVTLRHSRVHGTDCAECETTHGMLDRVECDIALRGALSEAQRSRLLEIANMCPVHKTLTSEVHIRTRLV